MAGYQILGIRSYYDESKRKQKSYDAFFEKRWRVDDVKEIFHNPAGLLDRLGIPPEERWNLYYTISNCKDAKRVFNTLELIPFDLDGIDVARIQEYIEPVLEILQAPTATVVASGNGLHFILRSSNLITTIEEHEERRTQYKAILKKINSTLESKRLPGKADPAVWDVARLLRMPETVNRKPDKKNPDIIIDKRCTVLQPGSLEPTPFDWDAISGAPKLNSTEAIQPGELRRFRKHSGEAAMQQCAFLKHTKDDAVSLPELEWYAAASIVGVFEKGRELFHEISKPHPGYSPSATDEKLAQALAGSGPRTCKNIDTIWGKCSQCPLWGTIKSPVVIMDEEVIPTEIDGFHNVIHTERGPKYVPNYGDLLRKFEKDTPYFYDAKGEVVYAYQGTYWQRLYRPQLKTYAEKMFVPTPTKDEVRNEFANKVFANNVWAPKDVEKFLYGRTDGKINLSNGVLDPITKILEPHHSDFGFTYVLPYGYDPDATSPLFDKFLDQVTVGRQALKNTLLDFMAYTLVPRYDHHCFLWLTAGGRNGKSAYMNILANVVGEDNCDGVLLDQFENDFSLAQIRHKLVNFSEESESKKIPAPALTRLKLISGGGGINVSEKNEKNFRMRTTCKLVFASNQAPGIDNVGQAIHSRMIAVPFDLELEDMRDPEAKSKVDLDLEDHIINNELPGILNHLVARLHTNGHKKFRVSENEVTRATKEEIFRASDTLERWFYECAELEKEASTWLGDLRKSFDEFMGLDTGKGTPPQSLILRLKKKFPKKVSFSARKRRESTGDRDYQVIGLRLKEESENKRDF